MVNRLFPALRKKDSVRTRGPQSLWEMMDDMFRSPVESWKDPEFLSPPLEVSDNEHEMVVKAELPGLDQKDIHVTMESGNLIIQGEKKVETCDEKDNCVHREMRYGSFYRSVPLPAQVQEGKISATYKNGVLKVVLPKDEKAKPKRIAIK